ncbi:hypothetical protein DLR60_14080 [Vibrio tarriae]|uniref:hypothetical protein n=1 Tax=Vibrio tarriae TaxID=2014742 RepID=UPI000DE4665A|nr:hypothetical protein [Vibrio tarriae]MCU8333030.1 hypothetical protein [Vibrio vulnificus]RBM67380.1 hypothetical protein DLR60_14080 [Vibrio tarriae]
MYEDGPQRGDVILIDANVIIHADQLKTWNAISQNFKLHTVEKVIEEAIRKPIGKAPISIDEPTLRSSFAVIYDITEEEKSQWIIDTPEILTLAVDDGEADLLAYLHTCGKEKVWFLCGPDVGSMKGLHKMGMLEQLVSLERLHQMCGINKKQIQEQYTQKWHTGTTFDIRSNLR